MLPSDGRTCMHECGALPPSPTRKSHCAGHPVQAPACAGRVRLRAVDAKSLGALAAQAAYTAPLTLPAPIRARLGRLG